MPTAAWRPSWRAAGELQEHWRSAQVWLGSPSSRQLVDHTRAMPCRALDHTTACPRSAPEPALLASRLSLVSAVVQCPGTAQAWSSAQSVSIQTHNVYICTWSAVLLHSEGQGPPRPDSRSQPISAANGIILSTSACHTTHVYTCAAVQLRTCIQDNNVYNRTQRTSFWALGCYIQDTRERLGQCNSQTTDQVWTTCALASSPGSLESTSETIRQAQT